MKLIKLTQNKYTKVDNEDFESLNKLKWYTRKDRKTFYAARNKAYNRGTLHMHRIIVNCPTDKEVDHLDRDGLNNQKVNLRVVNRKENLNNKGVYKLSKANKSGIKGVTRHTKNNAWVVQKRINGKNKYLGSFADIKEAKKCYEKIQH